MSGAPGPDELVAIVAAYVVAMRDRRGLAAVPDPVANWRLASRIDVADAPAARVAGRRSAWRSSIAP